MRRFSKAAAVSSALALASGGLALALAGGSAGAQGTNAFTSYACAGGAADGTTISTDLSGLQEGGTLLLSGTCGSSTHTISVSLPAGVTLEGSEDPDTNDGTQIDGNITDSGSGEGDTIMGLTVNCEGTGAGLDLDGWREKVQYVTTTDCVDGLELVSSTGGNVNDSFTNDFFQVNSGATDYPVYVNDSGNNITDATLADSYLSGGEDGIYSNNGAGWTIDGNHIYGNAAYGMYITRNWGTRIVNNYIESWGNGDAGIQVSVQPGAVGTVIADNAVFENDAGTTGSGGGAGAGIAVFSNSCATTACYATVSGNMIVNTDSASTSNYGIEGSGSGLTYVTGANQVQGANATTKTLNSATKGTAV